MSECKAEVVGLPCFFLDFYRFDSVISNSKFLYFLAREHVEVYLRAHETVLDLVCRLLLEKKKKNQNKIYDVN